MDLIRINYHYLNQNRIKNVVDFCWNPLFSLILFIQNHFHIITILIPILNLIALMGQICHGKYDLIVDDFE